MASFWIPRGRCVRAVGGVGEALGTITAGVGDVQRGIALHGGREHDLRAIGRPSGGIVGAAITGEGNEFAGVEGVHADLGADDATDGNETSEGDARGVRRPTRRERDGTERGELVLIRAVIIHDPKFLGAVGAADESDLGGGDAGEATGEFADDFVGKLMSEFADLRVGGSAAINLADDGLDWKCCGRRTSRRRWRLPKKFP